eukprot:m51a1_g13349 hypothetical protein (313) ;mRNA; f:96-2021
MKRNCREVDDLHDSPVRDGTGNSTSRGAATAGAPPEASTGVMPLATAARFVCDVDLAISDRALAGSSARRCAHSSSLPLPSSPRGPRPRPSSGGSTTCRPGRNSGDALARRARVAEESDEGGARVATICGLRAVPGLRGAMFGLCHGLYQCATQKTEYKVLVIGLDGAGKTTLLERIKAMYSTRPPLPPHNIRPTVGLNIGRVEMGKLKLVLWDLGGVVQLRVIWPKYFREAQGIIYVVDSNNPGRFEESRLELEEALASPDVALETPVLVLANKQDEPEACGVSVVEAALRVEQADRPHINIQPVVAHTGA